MSVRNVTGGGIGTFGSLQAVVCGDALPDVVLTGQFTTTGPTSAVAIPGGAAHALVRQFVTGAPTSATVIVEGSTDGVTWTALTTPKPSSTITRYTQVRLNCTALAGGTSPTIIAVGVVVP